jgi:hypothetical protein
MNKIKIGDLVRITWDNNTRYVGIVISIYKERKNFENSLEVYMSYKKDTVYLLESWVEKLT